MTGRIAVKEYTDITLDSRSVRPEALFVALKGTATDGHDHLADAFARGAGAALVSEARLDECRAKFPGKTFHASTDVAADLPALARAFFRNADSELRLVGVTGTNGKTTTTHLLRDLLRAAGRGTALLGTVGYDLGSERWDAPNTTPDPILLHRAFRAARDRGATDAVLEASSHGLALGRLAGLTFDLGVFTNLTQDHLDFHSGMEDYFQAKRKLFAMVRPSERPNAVVFLADEYGVCLASDLGNRAITAAAAPLPAGSPAPDLAADEIRCDLSGTRFVVRASPRAQALGAPGMATHEIPLLGRTNVANALTAYAAGLALDLPEALLRETLARAKAVPGRFEIVPSTAPFRVAVDYAHTPDAVARLIETGRALSPRRLLLVFGCGGDRDPKKRPIMGRIASEGADRVFVTSDNPRTENPEKILDGIFDGISSASRARVTRILDRREAIRAGVSEAGPGDLLLIAGKGHEDYQILGRVKHPFDDRIEAAEALRDARMKASA